MQYGLNREVERRRRGSLEDEMNKDGSVGVLLR